MSDGLDYSAFDSIPEIPNKGKAVSGVGEFSDIETDFSFIKEVDSLEDLSKDKDVSTPEDKDKNKDKDKDSKIDLLDLDVEEDEDEDEVTELTDVDPDKDLESDPYKIWGEWASEKGIIDFDIEEYKKAEDKEEYIFNKQAEKFNNEIENYKATRHPLVKALLDYDEQDLDIAKILSYEKNIQSYEKIKADTLEEDINLQKNLIKDFLIKSGQYTAEEAASEIEDFEDSGLLLKKAEKALPKLVALEKQAKEKYIEAEKEAERQELEKYNTWVQETQEYVNKLDTLLPGIKVSEKEKRKIFESITKVDARDGKTEFQRTIAQDPKKFNAMAAYFASKNWDFSALERDANTKVIRKVKETVNTYKDTKPSLSKVDINVLKKAFKYKG